MTFAARSFFVTGRRYALQKPLQSSSRLRHQSNVSANKFTMSKPSGPVGVVSNDAKTGPKGEPMTPIPSASLIILSPIKGDTTQRQYATLMVQRSARAGGSFRSAVVFPGGLLDQADVYAIEQDAKRGGQNEASTHDRSAQYIDSLRLCALREAFEETGLLLIPTDVQSHTSTVSRAIGPRQAGLTDTEWTAARTSVHDDARNFLPFIRSVMQRSAATSKVKSLSAALQPLHHHSNWVTPRNMVRPAKRFDTHFFVTVLDTPDALGQLSNASAADLKSGATPPTATPAGNNAGPSMAAGLTADGSETTSLRLATPVQLMELAIRDEIILYPPQFYLLADVHTTLAKLRSEEPIKFQGLYFGQEPDSESSAAVTSISSVEPQGKPGDGAMIARTELSSTGGKHGGGQDEVDEQDQVFVMPLALPGDALRPVKGQKDVESKRNRVFVTLRSKGEGGGMMVHGSQRLGIDNLHDFQFGHILSDTANEDEKHETIDKAKL